jgi:hypothetical protein
VPKAAPADSVRLVESWASFPKLTTTVRQARESKSVTITTNFKDLLKSSGELYNTTMLTLDRLRAVYVKSKQDIDDAKNRDSTTRARFMYAYNQRIYIMAAFTACYINCLIRAMLPAEERAFLREEAVRFSNEIVSLAYQAMPFRPLGAAIVPLSLLVAWFVPIDDETRNEIVHLWEQYRSDFPATRDLDINNCVEACSFLKDDY